MPFDKVRDSSMRLLLPCPAIVPLCFAAEVEQHRSHDFTFRAEAAANPFDDDAGHSLVVHGSGALSCSRWNVSGRTFGCLDMLPGRIKSTGLSAPACAEWINTGTGNRLPAGQAVSGIMSFQHPKSLDKYARRFGDST